MRLLRALRPLAALLVCGALAVSCTEARSADSAKSGGPAGVAGVAALSAHERIVPAPASTAPGGPGYTLGPGTAVRATAGSAGAKRVAELLAEAWRPVTGLPLPVSGSDAGTGRDGLRLRLDGNAGAFGEEGYRLEVDEDGAVLTAHRPAGLFRGAQTLRQLLPPARGPWTLAGGTVTDTPRFGYRGAMLDVARHFFTVEQVKKYVDQLALYKINTLHLHLTDDQGWRIAVASRPRLASYGGASEVGGGPGGHWTQEQYRDLVAYAGERYIEVVPEIDVPGHTNAALASYAELNCNGIAPARYTGVKVGFSSLCVPKEETYAFVDDVLREIAALTPGRYLHIGGDEAHSTSRTDYRAFMDRVQPMVADRGKTVLAWHQLTGAQPAPGAVVQYWGHDRTTAAEKAAVADAARAGTKVVLSPADRIYLDMKYDRGTVIGTAWAGYVPVRRAYEWDPGAYLPGVPEESVLGVEAPLWTETVTNGRELEQLAFPRVIGAAELGWSKAAALDWDAYRLRLAAQGPRLDALGVRYFRAPDVPWE
ncbi:beta-N-acetylhexosaminidase [Streptomyces bambusae]|uniref:beta-N-acetylhexosaminidase n=1 Tax=Streptomyces bambusae TaxID=1550616 RepID=UPI001CFCDD6D|nr:beta-N-acetylhexosaminidase [Streptomyces bambusae]MCB5167862.1 beta-N-acetylhexosaminidase [Streptomyces bambusae]